jgi:uncharacterized integral membrane protein (TIGR00698 family)
MQLAKRLLGLIPGIGFLVVVGLLGWLIGEQIPYISYLLVCIALGLLISNTLGVPAVIERGIVKTYKVWLEAGIMVLGARVILADLLAVGPVLLGLVVFFLLFSLGAVQYLSHLLGIPPRLGSTLASGVSVCGVSAVIATGGGIQLKPKDMAYAIAAVLVFDIFTVFAWPLLGHVFSIPSEIFGPWAGLTSPSTGTTVAIGLIHSDRAGELATIVKMARNATIGIWALLFTVYYARAGLTERVGNKWVYLWDKFPKFVLAFIVVMLLANVGLLSETEITHMTNAYSWLFMLAFVGLGYDINLKDLKQTGIKPLIATTSVFVIVSILSMALLYAILGT